MLREAFRVLKPGGRFAVSDIVIRRELPESVRESMEMWTGCVAGALLEKRVRREAARRGLHRHRGRADARLHEGRRGRDGVDVVLRRGADGGVESLDGAVMSAFVRAKKP